MDCRDGTGNQTDRLNISTQHSKWLTFYATYLNKFAHFKHWISWDAPTAPMGKSLQPAHYGILFYTKKQKEQNLRITPSAQTRQKTRIFVERLRWKKTVYIHLGL